MSMVQLMETDSISCQHSVSTYTRDSFDLHCHSYYEIYYIISGQVQYRVEGQAYRPEPYHILLIPAKAFHGVMVESTEVYERYAFHFLPELLTPQDRSLLLKPFQTGGTFFRVKEPEVFLQYCDSLLECSKLPPHLKETAIRCRLEALLTHIQCIQTPDSSRKSEEKQSVQNVLRYLNTHLQEPLTLESVSSHFFLSKNYLNHLFKEATGTTIGSYLCYKRAALAQQLLLDGVPASDAALASGFTDYSTFYRTYKKIFGHAPSQVQQKTFS